MEVGVRSQRGGRLHPVGPRHWYLGGDRGGAPPPLCSHDPRQGRSASVGTTTFLYARSKCPGRSPSLCLADALYPRWSPRPIRPDKLAGCCDRRSPAGWNSRRAHQCRRPHARDVAIAMAAVPNTGPDTTRSYVRSISERGLTVRRRYNRQPRILVPNRQTTLQPLAPAVSRRQRELSSGRGPDLNP